MGTNDTHETWKDDKKGFQFLFPMFKIRSYKVFALYIKSNDLSKLICMTSACTRIYCVIRYWVVPSSKNWGTVATLCMDEKKSQSDNEIWTSIFMRSTSLKSENFCSYCHWYKNNMLSFSHAPTFWIWTKILSSNKLYWWPFILATTYCISWRNINNVSNTTVYYIFKIMSHIKLISEWAY